MDRYLVISSDTHAGPPSEAYRDYVDPQYREAFDEDLTTKLALRSIILEAASEEQEKFREEWEEETGDGGKLASYDPTVRDAELDKDGVADRFRVQRSGARPVPSAAAGWRPCRSSTTSTAPSPRCSAWPRLGSGR